MDEDFHIPEEYNPWKTDASRIIHSLTSTGDLEPGERQTK